MAGEGALDGAAHERFVGEIAPHVRSLPPPAVQDFGARLEIEAGDRAAFAEQSLGNRKAHASTGPGHEGTPVGEAHGLPSQ